MTKAHWTWTSGISAELPTEVVITEELATAAQKAPREASCVSALSSKENSKCSHKLRNSLRTESCQVAYSSLSAKAQRGQSIT